MTTTANQDRICLVTGATSGIGRATAEALAPRFDRLIVHGRDADKTREFADELQHGYPETVVVPMLADFASLSDVQNLARQVAEECGALHVLINNAGVLTDERRVSHDGFEWTFAVNHLAPLLLTELLLGLLRENAPARIAFNSSSAMGSARLDFADLQMERGFDGWTAYANTKLANMLMSQLYAQQLADAGVVSNAFCPGLVDTHLLTGNRDFGLVRIERMRAMMRTAEEGAVTPVFLATSAEAAAISGTFFLKSHGNGTTPLEIQWNRETAGRLRQVSLRYLAPWMKN